MTAELVVASCFILLGIAHSVLGESDILKPLFAAEWTTHLPRWALDRILRFAWHLTSITWFAIAAIVLGANLLLTIGISSIASAAMVFVMLRGHLAWPLFLLAGLAALQADGVLGTSALRLGAFAAAGLMVAAALLHVYWAGGGTWYLDKAAPQVGENGYRPGPIATLAVAIALTTFATLIVVATRQDQTVASWLVGIGIAVLTVRAIGDTKVAGFTKTIRDTEFAKADDAYFTPIIVFLALGATGALIA